MARSWRLAFAATLILAGCVTTNTTPTLIPTHPIATPGAPAASDTPDVPIESPAPPTITSSPETPVPAGASPTVEATFPPIPTPPQTTPPPPGTAVQPVIHSFTIAPALIHPGESVTLTWEASAGQVVIYRVDALLRLTMPAYEVPLSGTLTLTTPETLRNQVHFVLFAISPSGSAQAGVSAAIICPDTWFFANPPAECPASPPSRSRMVKEDFERGHMLWVETSGLIYILYDNAASGGGASWEIRPNAWQEGMALFDPNLTPPAGLYQPVRGFGLAWRDEQMLAGTRVRDRIGWATNAEYEWGQGAVQCNSAPKYNTCFIGGPGGLVYALEPERSGWFVWTGPTPTP